MPRGGSRGGGNPGYGLNKLQSDLRTTLLKAVQEDCEKNPERRLYWAKEFSNKLLPQQVEGSGDNGEIVISNPSLDKYLPDLLNIIKNKI